MGARQYLVLFNWIILISLLILNLFTVFLPEVGFDALWYHLTLPKLYLLKSQWYFPGGLLYYSVMPRFMETIYIPLISFSGSIGPKLTQYISGVVTSYVIYRIVKKFTASKLVSLTALNLFYATWLVCWQSGSAYVDLSRTMFEALALFFLVSGHNIKKYQKLILSGIFLGLAIGTKWNSLLTLVIYSIIFSPALLGIGLFVAMPWFGIATYFTGNPIYPLGEAFLYSSQLNQVPANYFDITEILTRIFSLPIILTFPYDDFLSPMMGVLFIISLASVLSSKPIIRKISLIGLLGALLFILTPPPSSRYLLPFLPPIIISASYLISRLRLRYALFFCSLSIISGLIVVAIRANSLIKYAPLVSGRLTLNQYLSSQSAKLPGTFIDSDDYVSDNLPSTSRILIDKLHNLYYFPYNFDHSSWVADFSNYDYLVTIGEDQSSISGRLLHTNNIGIQVFKLD